MLRCGNVPAGVLAVNAASGRHMNASEARETGTAWLGGLQRIGRLKGSERESLAVNIGRLVAGEEQRHRRDFLWRTGALQRIELADLMPFAGFAGTVKD